MGALPQAQNDVNVIAACYEAAIDATRWPAALERRCRGPFFCFAEAVRPVHKDPPLREIRLARNSPPLHSIGSWRYAPVDLCASSADPRMAEIARAMRGAAAA